VAWVRLPRNLDLCAYRFRQFAYGLGGIIALFHDVTVTYGAISILNLEYSLSLLAVILTIIGFSINDTIVIFDRVRGTLRSEERGHYIGLQHEHQ